MKRTTASDARRNWFRLLDEVAAGEVVVIERNGRRIRIESVPDDAEDDAVPDYTGILRAPLDVEEADRWGWDWDEEGGLLPVEREGE